MAFPVVAASGSGQEATATLNHSVAIPATPGAGNLILLLCHTNDHPNEITAPAGFIQVGSPDFVTPGTSRWGRAWGPAVFAKISNGTETTPVVFTTATTALSTHIWIEISNVASDVLISGVRITATTDFAFSTLPDPPNNALPTTYDWNGSDILYLAAATLLSAATTFTGHPATYTLVETVKLTGQGTGISVARKDVAALSENPGTFTLSGNDYWVALTIAIRSTDTPSYPTDITQFLSEVGYSASTKTTEITQLLSEVGYSANDKTVDVTQYLSEVGYSAGDKTTDITQLLFEVAYVPILISEDHNRRMWVGSWI